MPKGGSVNVRFAPKATEVLRCRELTRCAITGCEQSQQGSPLFDQLVGATEQRDGEGKTKRPSGSEVDYQLYER